MAVIALSVASVSVLHAQKIRGAVPTDWVPDWVHESARGPVPQTDADIAWLYEEKIVEPLAPGGVRETERTVGKLLRQSGAERISSYSVVYGKDDEVVSFNAWALLPDGTARRAVDDPRDGDIRDMPYMASFSVYEDRRLRVATVPGVVAGSIVAHESVVERAIDLGAAGRLFGFADEPTALSRFTLRLPPGWGWEAARYRDEPVRETESENGVVFTAENLGKLPRDDQRPPLEELLPQVWLRWWSPDGKRGFADWNAVARWERELAEPVLERHGGAAAVAARLKPEAPERMLNAIGDAFAYVSRQIRYVSIQIGIGGYRPYAPGEVVSNGYGDCKDKAFLYRSLVGDWGLKSYPVLVRTRDLGRLLPEVPSPGLFNHMIVAVELPAGVGEDLWATREVEGLGRLLFLDGTANRSDAWTLPSADQGTEALLIHPDGGTLVRLPVQPPAAALVRREVRAEVDDQGHFEHAQVTVKHTGLDASRMRGILDGLNQQERIKQRELDIQDWFPGASVVAYDVEHLGDPGQPVVERIELANGRAGKRVHQLLILEPGRMTRGFLGGNLPPPPRRWELRLAYPRTEEAEVRLVLPAGWVPDELPDATSAHSAEIATDGTWQVEEGVLTYRWSARLLTNRVPRERYEAFRETALASIEHGAQAVVFVPRP